ncbi:MAG: LamG-like jellyroll fold domain-containing protein, partial [Salibacteraceae bacterium]
MKNLACFLALLFLVLGQWTLNSHRAQAQGLLNPVVVDSFPQIITGGNSNGGETAVGMQGSCFTLPCCSVNVYKVVLPSNGVLRVEMAGFVPLAGTIIAYQPTVATPTAYSDLEYVAGTPGNFCGFRDTLQLGRAYNNWDLTPFGQVPDRTVLFELYDINNPSPFAGFFPAGDYYLLVFNGNQQIGFGVGTPYDLSFEFIQACEVLDVPASLSFANLEPNTGTDTLGFYLTNNRMLPVSIDTGAGLVISGADASEFSILTYPDTNLAVGDSTLMEVVFAPSSGGSKTAQLTISYADSACSADTTIYLSGIGNETNISILGNGVSITNNSSSFSLNNFSNMGAVVVNTGAITRSYTIQNSGTDTLELSGMPAVAMQAGRQFSLTPPSSTSLLPGASTTFSVTFTPTNIGLDTAQFTITNNDSNQDPFTFQVMAAGAGLNGLDFDGSGDYVNIDVLAGDMVGQNIFTVESWVKIDPAQSGNDILLGVNTSSNGARMFILMDDGIWELWVGTTVRNLNGPDIRDDAWHHVAFVYNNGTVNYYLDGTLQDTETNNVPSFTANDQWSIGQEWDNSGASDFFNGAVNEFRIWKTARTAAEVAGGRYCEANGLNTDLVAYYSFNQGVAGVSNTNISTLTDGSTNGFDGALNGFALNGTESNFILADNVAPACTSFQLQVCDAPTYTTPSGMVIDTNGLIADTIPNSLGGDSALLIDVTIDYTVVSQSNLSDTSFCGGSAYTGQMSTNLSSTYNFVKANSDYVTMDAVRDSLVNTNRSIFLWMRAAGTVDGDNQVLVGINTSGSSSVSIFGIRTNEQLWIFDGGNSRNSGVTVTDGNWRFVGYTYDEGSNQTQFWVDGVEAASFSNGQSISATSRISLGQEWDSSTPSDFFDGEMAEVSFWNEVLDSADIVAIMQSAITNAHPKYSNLVAYYPGNGECGVDGFSISDFGPNDYDGTATATSILNTDSLVVLPGFDPTSHYDLSVRMNGSVVATGNPFTIASTTNGAHVGALEKGYFAIYDTFNITSFPDPVAVINQGDSAFFAMGDSVQLTTTAQNGVAYEWFKGFDEDWRFIGPRGFSPGATNNTRAQVGPDGTIYAAFQDEANGDGISVMRYDGIAWQFVGSPGFSAGAVGDIDFKIAPDSTLYVAFEDKFTGGSGSNGKATVMYFDGAAWQTLGTTEFSAGGLIHISLEISQQDTVYVGYTDIANLNRGTVQRFNGTAWENVGPAGFTAGFAGPVDLGIAPDGTLYFGFGDITSGPATTVMTFDGTNWQILGTPGFSDQSDGSRTTSIAFDPAGVPYVGAVGGDNPFFVEVFRFDGNDWAQLDTALVNGSNPSYNAVAINPTGTVYTSSEYGTNSANRAPTVWQLTGSGWQPVGNPNFVFSQAIEGSLDFGVDGNPIYIFRDNRLLNGIGNRATAMRFGPEYLVNGTDVFASDTGNYILVAANSQGCTARDTIRVEQTIAQALLASAAVDSNASCNSFSDGGVTTTAIGGTTPYTYNWSNSATTASITGVVAGTYTATITDASGATGTASATITEPSAILVNTVVDSNASCNGFLDGGATASASGGTAPYTYLWSNSATTASITGVAAGMYTVSITDNNGCGPATATATITEPLALVAATVEDSSATCGTCSDGGATASATGGTMPYSYTWSNSATTSSITGVLPGTYSVTITDNNGCTDSSSITIATGLSAAIVVDSNVSCFGFATGGATATVSSGATPYTYLWSNAATSSAITGLVAGVYTVTVTDAGGLTASASASITQPTLLSASLVGTTNVSCNGLSDGSITTLANGGTAPYTYNWNNGDTIASLSGIVAGTYTLTLTDANGCSATFSQSISEPTAIVASNANILPDCGISNGAVDISISGGAAPYTHLWSNGATTEDIASIPAGTYTITITDNSGCTTTANYNVNNINGANASSVVTEPLCNGDNNGSIDVTTSGGTAPYTYAWSTGASTEDLNTLADGTYTLTITDATGCLTLLTDTLEEPAELQGDIAAFATAITPVSCSGGNDGAINLPIIGGTMPYSYLWSTGDTTQIVSNLSAGGYLVTVTDANGCTTGGPLTVPELSGMSLATNTTAATDYTTADGSATATVTNGTAPYTYLWSNSGTTATITGIPSGAYTVIVTDANGCSVEGYSYVGVVPSGCQTTLDWTQLGADEALMLPNYSTNGIDINLSFIESGGAGEDDNFSFEHDERGNIDTVGFVQLDMNPSSNNDPNQFNQLVIDFSAPVRNLSFAVTDIDAASSYADSMQVAAYDANGNVLTGFFKFVGDSIACDYSSDTLQAVGLGNSDNSQDFGNAGIVYPDSVSQLVVWQRTGRSGASNPGSHRIYVSALTFENDYHGVYDDNVAVTENDSIVIDVQANDALTCHAPQTTSVLSSPLFGTATVLGNDSIRYTPNPKFYGIDSLHYQVCDNNGLCDSAWVFVSVLPELSDSLAWTLNNADEALANDSQLVRLNRVDFTFSDPANIDASDNFTSESSSTRGQFVPASYLSFDINANSTTAPNEFVEVTMDFEQAVNGLYFHLIDVDNSSSGGGVDSVVVSAIG